MSTAAVVDDHFSEILDRATGVAAGFDVFVEGDQIEGTDDSDDAVVDLALATLSELPQGSPWFMWVHLFGPHVPSTKHPNTPSFGEGLVAEYDHEIHFVDEQIDRLLEGALARAPGAAYIVTADHGESLFANNRMHGFSLSDDEIHVPLIVGGEGIPATRVAAPVSTVDIVPTVLALTQTPMPDYLDGRSLLTDLGDARMLFSDAWRYNYDGSLAMELVGAFDATAKFVHSRRDNVVVMTDYAHPERSSEEAAQGVELRRYVDAVQEYLRAGPLMTSWSYRP